LTVTGFPKVLVKGSIFAISSNLLHVPPRQKQIAEDNRANCQGIVKTVGKPLKLLGKASLGQKKENKVAV